MDSLTRDIVSLGLWALAATYGVVAVAAWRLGRTGGHPHLGIWAAAALAAAIARSIDASGAEGAGAAFFAIVAVFWQVGLLVAGARCVRDGRAPTAHAVGRGLAWGLGGALLVTLTSLPADAETAALAVHVVQAAVVAAGFALAALVLARGGGALRLVALACAGQTGLELVALAMLTGRWDSPLPTEAMGLLAIPEWGLVVLASAGAFAALRPTQQQPANRATQAADAPTQHWTDRLEAMARLADRVAHDMNNALAAARGNVEWVLSSDAIGIAQRQALEDVEQAVDRGVSITRELQSLFAPPAEPPAIEDLNAIVRAAAGVPRAEAGETKNPIALQLAAGTVPIRCVAAAIERAARSLLARARSVSSPGSPIEVRTVVDGDRATLSIADAGEALSAEGLANLFDPFAENATAPGLTRVWTAARSSGGRLDVASAPGRGTTIRITWPLRSSEPVLVPRAPRRAPTRTARTEGAALRILLAEDDEPVRANATRALTQAGHDVVAVEDGRRALDAFERGRFDLVITDVRMPRLDGIQLSRRIRERDPGIPVLLISGFVGAEQAAPMDLPLLHKPFTGAELLAFVARSAAPAATAEG